MTTDRAYQIATKVVFTINDDSCNNKWELVKETADLARAIENAAFFQRMFPIRNWYNKINQEINNLKRNNCDDDCKHLVELNELLEMLDEWEEDVA